MSLLSYFKKAAKPSAAKKGHGNREAAVKQEATAESSVASAAASRINLRPQVTEKSMNQGSSSAVVFRVVPQATKGQIAAAIRERYGINPRAVRTTATVPKTRRRGSTTGRTTTWKKAYVTLPAGKTLDLSV